MTGVPTRRERLRVATLDEIKRTARRLLVDEGPQAISLRAIAREMGMTAPALYRYVPSHEALLDTLCRDLKQELVGELERARDALPGDQLGARMRATCEAFRGWAVAHPAEFSLMFASAKTDAAGGQSVGEPGAAASAGGAGLGPGGDAPCPVSLPGGDEEAFRFGKIFLDLIVPHYQRDPFPVPDADLLPPDLRTQLRRFLDAVDVDVPVGVAYVFLSGWIRLYGLVALEVFGHLSFALDDVRPLFETEMGLLAAQIGFTDPTAPSGPTD